MKYVIDIEDEPLFYYDEDTHTYFPRVRKAIGFKTLVFDEDGLEKLTPLDKALEEAYQKGYDEAKLIYQNPNAESDYQRGLDDAWEAFKKLMSMWLNDDDELFAEDSFLEFTNKVTASEAIAKVTEYEKEKKDHLRRDIQQDIDTLMSSTGMTIEEIADALKQMKGGADA